MECRRRDSLDVRWIVTRGYLIEAKRLSGIDMCHLKTGAHGSRIDIVAGIMNHTFVALAIAGLLPLVQNSAAQTQLKYPAAQTSNQVDDCRSEERRVGKECH